MSDRKLDPRYEDFLISKQAEIDRLRAELEAERNIRAAVDEEFLKTGLGVPETKPETYAAHVAEIWQALEAAKREAWQPIETAPFNQDVLLYCPDRGIANSERIELGTAHTSRGSHHSWATHWMPLPEIPDAAIGARAKEPTEAPEVAEKSNEWPRIDLIDELKKFSRSTQAWEGADQCD